MAIEFKLPGFLSNINQSLQNMSPEARVGLISGGLSLLSNPPPGQNTAGHVLSALNSGFGTMQALQLQNQQQKQAVFDRFSKLDKIFGDLDDDGKKAALAALKAGRLPEPAELTFLKKEEKRKEPQRFQALVTDPLTGEQSERFVFQKDGRTFLNEADPSSEIDPANLTPLDRSTRVNVNTQLPPETKALQVDNKFFQGDLGRIEALQESVPKHYQDANNVLAMRELFERTPTGSQGAVDLKRGLGNLVGFLGGDPSSISGLSDINQIEARSFDLALTKVKALTGPISEKELNIIQQSVAGIKNTRQANLILLDTMYAGKIREAEHAQFMRAWFENVPNPKQSDAQRAWNTYTEENRVFDPSGSLNPASLSSQSWQPYLNPAVFMTDEEILRQLGGN